MNQIQFSFDPLNTTFKDPKLTLLLIFLAKIIINTQPIQEFIYPFLWEIKAKMSCKTINGSSFKL